MEETRISLIEYRNKKKWQIGWKACLVILLICSLFPLSSEKETEQKENLFLEYIEKIENSMKAKEWEKALGFADQIYSLKINTARIQDAMKQLKKNILLCKENLLSEVCQAIEACMKAKEWEKALFEASRLPPIDIEIKTMPAVQKAIERMEQNISICKINLLEESIAKKQWNTARKMYWELSQNTPKAKLEKYAPKIPKILVQYELPKESNLYAWKEYEFKAKSKDRIYQILWEYGDGESSDKAETKHIYKKKGEILLKLTLNDGVHTIFREKAYKIAIFAISQDERYEMQESKIIYDTKTGLQWLVGTDKDTDWDEAKAWVESISSAQYGRGWRMPTRAELSTIYEQGKGSCNIDTVFLSPRDRLWVWSGETEGSSSAWYFRFHHASEDWGRRGSRGGPRAFAVRAGRQ